jgi:hypothetical protein
LIKSKILLATTYHWFSTARLAMAFADLDCVVEAVHPPKHLLDHVASLRRSYPYHGLSPLASIRAAIVSAQPNLIIPCDDVAALHLHHLYESVERTTDAESQRIRAVLEESLGDSMHYPLIQSRSAVAAIACSEGIPTPLTDWVASDEQVGAWIEEHGLPAVLKADGTSGGEGVKIVRTKKEALQAFRNLRSPVRSHIVIKRALIDRETNLVKPWLQCRKRTVSIQSFVTGQDANIAIACWRGKVLGSISAQVLCTSKPKGPASLVRLLPDGEMLRAAEKIVGRLKISGLCGLDFVIDEKTNIPYFIELNARSTQTCHLVLGNGRNLTAALYAQLAKSKPREMSAVTTNEIIAIFPSAWLGNPACDFFHAAYHDVPWDEPNLVRAGMARRHRFSYEAWRKIWPKLRAARDRQAPAERKL